MKLAPPENQNYAATVVEIKAITPLEKCDFVVGTPLLGFQAVVGKDTRVGDVGIVFPAEVQLSEEYCRENNLFRDPEKNRDPEKKGYFENNRRVRAQKFRGHRSDCLFMPLESLAYTKAKVNELKPGDTFDTLGTYEICKKYVIKTKGPSRVDKNKKKIFKRVDAKFIPEHFDTDNYWRNRDAIPEDALVYVTQKVHGTSIRIANTVVRRKLKFRERLAKVLGVKVQETEMDYVFGSRKVVKDPNNPNQNHFYNEDIWTIYGKQLEGILPENFIVYGELIGWTPDGAPIQPNYTYQIPQGHAELFVYRVAFINGQGWLTDLSWDGVREFCRTHGLRSVPELWRGFHRDFEVDNFIDVRFRKSGYTNALPLGPDKKLVDEGVCIRVDRLAPYILKAKSPIFLQHETKLLDKGEVDLESVGSEEEEVAA